MADSAVEYKLHAYVRHNVVYLSDACQFERTERLTLYSVGAYYRQNDSFRK
jgi:hypothetical protein